MTGKSGNIMIVRQISNIISDKLRLIPSGTPRITVRDVSSLVMPELKRSHQDFLMEKGLYHYIYSRIKQLDGVLRMASPTGFVHPSMVTFEDYQWSRQRLERAIATLQSNLNRSSAEYPQFAELYDDIQQELDNVIFLVRETC